MSKMQLVPEQATRNVVNDLTHGAETLHQALTGTEDHTIRVGVGDVTERRAIHEENLFSVKVVLRET